MAGFERAELDEMVRRWVVENQRCEEKGDWKPLAEMGEFEGSLQHKLINWLRPGA